MIDKSLITAACILLFIVAGIETAMLLRISNKPVEKSIKDGQYEHLTDDMWSSIDYRIEERKIDSCEYIIIYGTDSRNLIHKANCRNAFHKMN